MTVLAVGITPVYVACLQHNVADCSSMVTMDKTNILAQTILSVWIISVAYLGYSATNSISHVQWKEFSTYCQDWWSIDCTYHVLVLVCMAMLRVWSCIVQWWTPYVYACAWWMSSITCVCVHVSSVHWRLQIYTRHTIQLCMHMFKLRYMKTESVWCQQGERAYIIMIRHQ